MLVSVLMLVSVIAIHRQGNNVGRHFLKQTQKLNIQVTLVVSDIWRHNCILLLQKSDFTSVFFPVLET